MGASLNELSIEVFSSGTTRIDDPLGDIARIEDLQFSTGYPGGLYLAASMFVPRDMAAHWFLKGAQRIRISSGQTVVYEGVIGGFGRKLTTDEQGIRIDSVGHWSALLVSRRLRRLYADQRTSEVVWIKRTGTNIVAETVNISRSKESSGDNELKILPQQGQDWALNDLAALRYTAPMGETIRRIEWDHDFSEGAQIWTGKWRDISNLADLLALTATASATGQSAEPAAGCSIIELQLISGAAQTTPADQSVYFDMTNIRVYATMNHAPTSLATVDLTEIAKDIRAELSGLSVDEDLIASNTLALKPFLADRYPTMADIIIAATKYGDASQNQWAVGVRGSHLASDDKPKLFAEQYPVLTDFDYAIRADEPNLVGPFELSEGYVGTDDNRVWNWIVVEFSDEGGRTDFVTPDDDANLKDQTSIDAYDQRDRRIRVGHSTVAAATNLGRRFLAAHKDPVWNVNGPLSVMGHMRNKEGLKIPAAQIVAGKRVILQDFLRDPRTGSADLIFLVTKTDYVDDEQVCNMTVGVPNSLDVYLAQRELVDERLLG